jgi:hypothetical protein
MPPLRGEDGSDREVRAGVLGLEFLPWSGPGGLPVREPQPVTPLSEPSHRDPSDRSGVAPRGLIGGLWLGGLLATTLLVPVLLAIWMVPGFITQDGPAHLYNAAILSDSFAPQSPYHPYYEVRWQPLPNWAGHLALAGLLKIVSPWVADRIMTSATLVGFAASIVWLRWKVRGGQAMLGPCLLAALLSMNYLWLMGFTGFLLGSCLFPITLGVWWSGRDRPGPVHFAQMMILIVLGYFCHLVSLGLTVVGLIILALLAPLPTEKSRHRGSRLGRTVISFLPLVPLGLTYLRLSRQGGPMHPVWENLADPYSPSAWAARLGWVDPLTLAMKDVLPFTDQVHKLFSMFSPVIWLTVAGMCWWAGRLTVDAGRDMVAKRLSPQDGGEPARSRAFESRRNQGVWVTLAALMMLLGFVGPDSLGSGHGEYLPQRLELLGLVALVPAFDLNLANKWGRLAAACLLFAVVLQTLIIWDYALYSERTAGQIMRAGDLIGRGQRIATLLIRIRSRFRVNPVLHADSWLGVGTGNILWSNYETRHYYFPVQFRAGIDRPDSSDLEWLAIHGDPREASDRARLWRDLLREHSSTIDSIMVWQRDPALDAITNLRYRLAAGRADVRVYTRRGDPIHEASAAHRFAPSPSSASSARRDKPRREPVRSP